MSSNWINLIQKCLIVHRRVELLRVWIPKQICQQDGQITLLFTASISVKKIVTKRKTRNSCQKWFLKCVFKFSAAILQKRILEGIKHWEKFTCIRFVTYDPKVHGEYYQRIVFKDIFKQCAAHGAGYKKDRNYDFVMVFNTDIDRSCQVNSLIIITIIFINPSNYYLINKRLVKLFTNLVIWFSLFERQKASKYSFHIWNLKGHVIGFRHEHSRPDRDAYVQVDKNVLNDYQFKIFNDLESSYKSIHYDLYSIMHYNNISIKSLDPRRSFLMGQRVALSFLDRKMANKFLQCTGLTAIIVQFTLLSV